MFLCEWSSGQLSVLVACVFVCCMCSCVVVVCRCARAPLLDAVPVYVCVSVYLCHQMLSLLIRGLS